MNPEEHGPTPPLRTPAYERVQFEQVTFERPNFAKKQSKLSEFVIKHSFGYVRDEKGVAYVAISFFILCLLLSLYFLFVFRKGDTDKIPEAFENKPYLPLENRL